MKSGAVNNGQDDSDDSLLDVGVSTNYTHSQKESSLQSCAITVPGEMNTSSDSFTSNVGSIRSLARQPVLPALDVKKSHSSITSDDVVLCDISANHPSGVIENADNIIDESSNDGNSLNSTLNELPNLDDVSTDQYGRTRFIQKAIHNLAFALNNWEGKLLFDTMLYASVPTSNYDILSLVDDKYKLFPNQVYFCRHKYPVNNGFSGIGWKDLVLDLERSSLNQGFSIFCNGYSGGKTASNHGRNTRVFKCKHGVIYRGNIDTRKQVSNYRVTKAVNDRQNGRGSKGKSLPRRSSTYRSLDKNQCCPFAFKVSFDANGFYVVNGYGSCMHYNHPQIVSNKFIYPARLLSSSEKKIAKSVLDSNVSKGVVKAVIAQRTGHTVSLQSCHYLHTLNDDLKRVANLNELSSSDKIIEFFKNKSYDYITLFNSVNIEDPQTPLMSDNNLTSRSLYSSSSFILPSNERKDAEEFSRDNRFNRQLSNEQILLVAIAWVIPKERRLFKLFPETIFVDVVEDTNKEGRPLLTITGCDGDGKMYTLLRAFLPNQRAWAFRWVFSHVLLTMFSRQTLSKVQIIISDGDAQEYHQIDNMINEYPYLSQIKRVRCCWHVIDRGWHARGPRISSEFRSSNYKDIVHLCKHWLYSWTHSACENENEYKISKQLFQQYLFSNNVVAVVGYTFGNMVLEFVRKHIEPVLPQMLFYKRKHIRHFDQNMNVKHEGTFSGLKYGCTPVGPSTTLEHSIITISNVAERKCGSIHKSKTHDVLRTKTWIKLRCGDKLNLRGEQLLNTQWCLKNKYHCVRVSPRKWLVRYDYENNSHESYRTIYPLFRRTRTVECKNNYFHCSCLYFERFGIPCRHSLKVMSSFPNYTEPSHMDVSVMYWKEYMHYTFNNDSVMHTNNQSEIGQLFGMLRNNDIHGPSCKQSLYCNIPIITNNEVLSKFNQDIISCSNYDLTELGQFHGMDIPSGFGVSMSQNYESEDDSSNQENILSNLNNMFSLNASSSLREHEKNSIVSNSFHVHSELNPLFKTLVSHLQENGDEETIVSVKDFLREKINEMEQTLPSSKKTKGKFVSSNSQYLKRRKTHGNK